MFHRESGVFKTTYGADMALYPLPIAKWTIVALALIFVVIIPLTIHEYYLSILNLIFIAIVAKSFTKSVLNTALAIASTRRHAHHALRCRRRACERHLPRAALAARCDCAQLEPARLDAPAWARHRSDRDFAAAVDDVHARADMGTGDCVPGAARVWRRRPVEARAKGVSEIEAGSFDLDGDLPVNASGGALNGVILQMFNHGLTAAALFWFIGLSLAYSG
jgi:hypothetical protein